MQKKKILHLGDIHFTLFKNHDQLYELIYQLKSDIKKKNIDLVYIGGDVVHEFNKLSPELVTLLKHFFDVITEEVPIVMIMGNHDWNSNNPDRLDSLTPLIANNPQVHYLKYTGVYNLYDILWCVWSEYDGFTLDEILETIKDTPGYRIGCYHGVVSGCRLYTGELMESNVSIETFDKCDTVFLADIHNRQYFRKLDIAYCGSTFQTNWGETDDEEKGGIIWEWNEKKKKFIPENYNIKSNYFLKTIKVTNCLTFSLDESYYESLRKKYKHLKLRLLYVGVQEKYDRILFNNLEKSLQKYTDYKIIKKREWEKHNKDTKKLSQITAQDYFKKWLEDNKVPQTKIDALKKLDSDYQAKLPTSDRDFSVCDIKSVELSHFGPFATKQKINFDDFQGLTGIVAENQTGKSFVLCAIAYSIWGETFREVSKDLYLIHKLVRQDHGGGVKIILSKDGLDYEIERFIETSGRVNLNFTCIDTQTSKNGKDRYETQKEIVKIFGDFDSFLLSNFYSANNGKDFLKLKQGARYDYFTDIMNLGEWESKHELANKDLLQLEREKSLLDGKLSNIILQDTDVLHRNMDNEFVKENKLIALRDILIAGLEGNKKDLYSIKIEDGLKTKKFYENELEIVSIKIINVTKGKEDNERQLAVYEEQINKILGTDDIYEHLSNKKANLQVKQQKIEDLQKEIDDLENGICNACQRPFSNRTIKEIEKDRQKIEKKFGQLEDECESLQGAIKILTELTRHIEESKKNSAKYDETNKALAIQHQELTEKLNKCIEQEDNIRRKEYFTGVIKDTEAKIREYDTEIKRAHDEHTKYKLELTRAREDHKAHTELTKELQELVDKIVLYELYVAALHKKGVRKLIIEDTIDSINSYLNLCLVDYNFEIQLLVNEKNEVDVLFIDESGVEQSATQCSGMETFIVNLSLRNAFNQITKKDKFNCFIIDEGFGTLDPTNLENCFTFLEKLKEYYDKIIIISHVDNIKAWLDNTIELEKVNGYTIIKN